MAIQPVDFVFQIAASPVKAGRKDMLLFSAQNTGLYRSEDDGLHWDNAYRNLNAQNPLATIAVCLAPDFGHEAHVFAGLNGAILRSYDAGNNWLQCRLPSPPPAVSCLVISPQYAEDGSIFAGTAEDGVLLSNDRGISWISWNFGLLDMEVLSLAISPDYLTDETLFAGTSSGLFRSTNGGRAWREIPLPVGFDAVLSIALSVGFAHDNTIYIGTENHGLLVSYDRGKTWQTCDETIREHPVNSIILSPANTNHKEIMILYGGLLMHTKDNGKTWKPWQNKKIRDRNVTSVLAPSRIGEEVYVGFEDGRVEVIRPGGSDK